MSTGQGEGQPMVDGYGAGEDARDRYLEAIKWWEHQLTEIERQAAVK